MVVCSSTHAHTVAGNWRENWICYNLKMFRVWCLLAVLLGCLCYWNSLDGDLVHDDIFAIRDNQDLRPDTPLSTLFLDDFWGEPMSSVVSHKSYRPLTVLSFRLNYILHGLQPWGYHLLNLLLHCLATLLFGWFCRREVFRGVGLASCTSGPGVAMLLFSTHPVHTEAVSHTHARGLSRILFLHHWFAHYRWLGWSEELMCLLAYFSCSRWCCTLLALGLACLPQCWPR